MNAFKKSSFMHLCFHSRLDESSENNCPFQKNDIDRFVPTIWSHFLRISFQFVQKLHRIAKSILPHLVHSICRSLGTFVKFIRCVLIDRSFSLPVNHVILHLGLPTYFINLSKILDLSHNLCVLVCCPLQLTGLCD